ncbi:MAG TPA: hypothetical protein VGV64_07605 [Thermoplasmata archaeon]|nr:hypothetical protein [Thermoplasmata archaeon]HEV2429689.1 hypothetical protein [Thermoplasmata archaeon]
MLDEEEHDPSREEEEDVDRDRVRGVGVPGGLEDRRGDEQDEGARDRVAAIHPGVD